MIDHKLLDIAYSKDSFYSLQLEVGDRCLQGCIYCYMNAVEQIKNQLSDRIILQILEEAKELGITAIEWLGGEPLLRNGIFDYMEKANILELKNNMWTGGLPFADKKVVRRTAKLCRNGLISFHLSTLNNIIYQETHPERSSEDIETIINGIKYLLDIGYPSDQILNSVTFTGYQSSEDMIETMEYFLNEYGIITSLNVYHTYLRPGASRTDLLRFIPSAKEVAKVYHSYKKLLGVEQLPMNCVNKQYCSATLAVLNNGYVTPCATIREEISGFNVNDHSFKSIVENNRDHLCFKLLKDKTNLPANCKKCFLNDICWGCRSRSFAVGNGIYGDDPRCFRYKKINN